MEFLESLDFVTKTIKSTEIQENIFNSKRNLKGVENIQCFTKERVIFLFDYFKY